ncbi:hypothetical protein CANDROIZ_600002 [Candidatus Roizmanbacteria bacterium]|nr:hypothetical protein CANDROIZ_600002 [Candidatus Roizmanbacteria bacterium]
MALIVESPTRRLQKSNQLDALSNKQNLITTRAFYAEHQPLLQTALINTFKALERFGLNDEERIQTAQEAVFLWTQAKLSQKAGTKDGNNKVSGFDLGAAVGFHIKNGPDNKPQFAFASGGNRESDTIAIADVHAETSAIERLKGKLDPLNLNHDGKFVDMVVIGNAAPCGSCRNEIYKHASDQSLVFVITNKGETSVNTIAELFPTKFDQYDLKGVSPELLETVKVTAQNAFPSRYQLPDVLPLWGVVMENKDHKIFQGFYSGDDGFWSNSPTMDAISNVLQWGINEFPGKGENESDIEYKERIRNQSTAQIERVVIHYEGKLPKVYPSGKERQQLSILPENTEIVIVEHNGEETRGFRTTRKDLLPGAFTA